MITVRNNNPETSINQVKSKEDFVSGLQSLTKTQKTVLNHLISLRSVFKNLFPSQSTIANAIDSGRTYTNECLQVIESLGFMSSTYYHRTSKSYKISPLFSNPFYRSIAMAILPALLSFPIYSILSDKSQKTDTITYMNLFKDFSLFTDTKIMTSDDQILKNREIRNQERLRKERLTTNVNKLFYDPEHPGDIYEAKNHKREVSKQMVNNEAPPKQSTKKLFPNALLNKAKDIWEKAQNGRMTLFRARSDLKEFKKHYPEGIDNLRQWYNSPEGLPLRKWIEQ